MMCALVWMGEAAPWITSLTCRLWRTIKQEEVYLNDYATPREARHGLSAYLRFYHEERIHQSLDSHPPAEVYFAH